jgi:hypothetical protein
LKPWNIKIVVLVTLVFLIMVYMTLVNRNYESRAQQYGNYNTINSLFISLLNGNQGTGWVELTVNNAPQFKAGGLGSYFVNVNNNNVGVQFPLPLDKIYTGYYVCGEVKVSSKRGCVLISSTDGNGASSVSLDLNSLTAQP